jgi:hypothetical protein
MPLGNASMELRQLGVNLRVMGEAGLMREIRKELRAGAAPLIPAVKQAALDQLPKGGGLNAQVAGQRVSVSIRTGARTAGVRLTTTAPDTAQTDSGYVRHPVFGKWRKGTPTQPIPAAVGWWSKTLERTASEVSPALLETLARATAALINRGV